MRYVTVKEMKELDSRAINQCGIPASSLMENAGEAIAAEAMKTFVVGRASRRPLVGQASRLSQAPVGRASRLSQAPVGRASRLSQKGVGQVSRLSFRKGKVFVFCGYGNNGGDGFVVGRHLLLNGYLVETFLVGNPKPFSLETQANYQALVAVNHTPVTVSTVEEIDKVFVQLTAPDLVIDAIFGIGIRGILDEFFLKLIDRINGFNCPVIAADIPSGLDADTGNPLGAAVKALKTVTLGYPKIGFQNPAAKPYLGEVICADIGLPALLCHSELM